MENRQLLNFLAVCEEKNFTRAAGKRHITQQGLSRSILELEAEIGAPLFDRSRRGAKLTEHGRVMESAARAYTNQHEYILETLKLMNEKSESRLSVGISIDYIIPPRFWSDFILSHPDIALSLKTFPLDTCQQHFLEQRLQIGFCHPPIDTDIFDAFLFEREKLYLVTGKGHRLAERSSVKMGELRKENVILLTTATHPNPSLLDLCRRNGIVPNTQLAAMDFALVAELCSTGRFVGFGGKNLESLKGLALIEIEDAEIYAEQYLIVNRHTFKSRAVEEFIAYAKERSGRAMAAKQEAGPQPEINL
jgi:DNA-binding transcriptional LysR family regulator